MNKDPRYKSVYKLIRAGKIKNFTEIFNYIPRCVVADELEQNYEEFCDNVHNPERFTVLVIISISYLFEVAPEQLITFIKTQAVINLPASILETYEHKKTSLIGRIFRGLVG